MVGPENCKPNRLSKIPRQYLLCFFSTIVWGVLAHGMTLFNKYSLYEDPSQLFGVGATYISGRWMLDILHRLEIFFLGGSYSLPLVNGLSTILYLAISACLVMWVLSVKKPAASIAIGGIMVTTPSITGTFGYMFTAPHYAFGTLLAVLGTALICRQRKWYRFVAGVILIACSVGIYQATIPIALCLLLLFFIKEVNIDDSFTWKKHFLHAGYIFASCISFVAVYFVANKLYLRLTNAQLIDYQGIDSMGQLPIGTYLRRGLYAYKQFLFPDQASSAFMYPNGMRFVYWAVLLVVAASSAVMLIRSAKEKAGKAILMAISLMAFPMAVNFIFVMCDPNGVHSLMVYSHVMVFIYGLWLADSLSVSIGRPVRYISTGICALVLLLSVLYVRFDNICYLKAELVQEQTISYCTTLVTQIKSVEGYTDGMPVAYINMQEKEDASVKDNSRLDSVKIIPYLDTSDMINNFSIRAFIENWCGFAPEVNYSSFANNPEFQQMPCYPDEGSIRIIDGVVVVKCK